MIKKCDFMYALLVKNGNRLLLFFVCIALSLNSFCQTISKMSVELNRSCPVALGDYGTLTKTSFSKNTLTFHLLNEDVNYDSLKTKDAVVEEWAKLFAADLYKDHYAYLFARMVDKKTNMRIVCKDSVGNKQFSQTLAPRQIKDVIREYGAMSPSLLGLYQVANFINMETPDDYQGTILKGAEMHPDYLEILYCIDENVLDLDLAFNSIDKIGKNEMKANLFADNDLRTSYLLTLLYKTDKQLKITYTGKYSGKSVSTILDKSDIVDLMRK